MVSLPGARRVSCPDMRFSDVCKRYTKHPHICMESRNFSADDSNNFRHAEWRGVRGIREVEERKHGIWLDNREHMTEWVSTTTPLYQTVYTCSISKENVIQRSDFLVTVVAAREN